MVKISNFNKELETEVISIVLFKKHITHIDKVAKETRKTRSYQIRELLDEQIRKCDRDQKVKNKYTSSNDKFIYNY